MKLLASLGLLAFSGSAALAWSIPAGIFAGYGHLAAEAAARGADSGPVDPAPPVHCLTNFSKDDCGGVVRPGTYTNTGCDITGCRTISVRSAVHEFRIENSGQPCAGPTSPCADANCDEFPDGTMTLRFDYELRADSCCPYRGYWRGKWSFTADSGLTYTGTANGTIGVGTNRASLCTNDTVGCENCYEVEYTDDGLLIVGVEGSFQGASVFSTTQGPNELHFTTDTDWILSADVREPFRQTFRSTGRYDGVHVRKGCP